MSSRFSLSHLILSISLTAAFAHAQLGVSPSQNAAFLSELRGRDKDHSKDSQDVLGDHRQLLERGRELSRPELFKYGGVDASRLEADISGFNSQYQLGRKYLSPFYNGWTAPKPSTQNPEGLTLGTALQLDVQNYNLWLDRTPNLVFSPTFLWDGVYKIDANQTFTFTGGLQFNIEGDNEKYDSEYWSDDFGFALLPGTSIAYDLDLDSLHVTAYDRVSARPYLGMLQNDLGLAATLDLSSRLSWTVNYTFSKTFDVDGAYGSYIPGINFDQHAISTELVFEHSSSLDLGLEGAVTWYNPDNEETGGTAPAFDDWSDRALNAQFYNVGLFGAWRLTDNTKIRLAGGVQTSRTYGRVVSNDLDQPQSDISSPYYSLAISQRLSDEWSHELAAGYENVLSLGGFYSRAHYVNYGVTGKVREGGQLTGSLFYERFHSPASRGYRIGNPVSTTGVDLHYSQEITARLTMDFSGSVVWGNEEGTGQLDETFQYMAGIGARYALTDRTQLSLKLQGFMLQYDRQCFDSSRLVFGVRTEF
ncbi:hypothetical protein [Brevifollis gellanilyticus]|uniref:Outer membrane protein beta-barrel domain-containing protein n=1 Tax=Brevifollis gellanilyticus TaxID=748831 RepID=A0A512MD86_9BACT|nr:hypothetical protein [Brevifollis gellanilyticus]GEP44700.1 hypothetical protein BGE01nite_39910 [Brevifollis gellanilyticus]